MAGRQKALRNIYVHTESECEEKLAEPIQQMKAEIAEAKWPVSEGKWEEAMVLAAQRNTGCTKKVSSIPLYYGRRMG